MKKVLAAAATLTLVGGAAFAEITVSGDAKLGIEYNSAPTDENGSLVDKAKQMLTREIGVDFIGSGTTDGGLSFGGKVGFDTVDGVGTGTAFVSGAFGTITYGHDDAADVLAGGIADVGLNGLGVDDVVEDIRGTTAPHARYDVSVGNFAFAISAETSDRAPAVANIPTTAFDAFAAGSFEVEKSSFAIGASFSASGATVGLGYDSKKAISAGIGYSNGPLAAKVFWAKRDQPYMHLGSGAVVGGTGNDADGTFDAGYRGHGIEMSYTMGASTLTMVYARTNLTNIQPIIAGNIVGIVPRVGFRGAGVGFSHDLGGGARLVAGFGRVPRMAVGDLGLAQIGQIVSDNDGDNDIDIADRPDLGGDRNVASVGLSFLF